MGARSGSGLPNKPVTGKKKNSARYVHEPQGVKKASGAALAMMHYKQEI